MNHKFYTPFNNKTSQFLCW